MSNMEVDESKEELSSPGPRISVHPLAIVNMADQYTRITCGGSPLDKKAPVVGLLFGSCVKEKKSGDEQQQQQPIDHVEILDADDIPTDSSEAATKQVSLHQAVFSQHQVVGWYRVAADDGIPNENDLRLTKELQDHYTLKKSTNKKSNSRRFVFGLLQVRKQQDTNSQEQAAEVPFNLYELKTIEKQEVLMGLDNWTLQTSEPERIAVERVVREQPTILNNRNKKKKTSTTTTKQSSNEKKNKTTTTSMVEDSNNNNNNNGDSSSSCEYTTYMNGVQNSLEAMKDRVQLLIDYLEKTQTKQIPPNYSLLRQIHALLLQLGPLANGDIAFAANNTDDSALLSHLAAVAKTIHSVYNYTEKFKTVHENRPSHPSGGGGAGARHRDHREGRGRF